MIIQFFFLPDFLYHYPSASIGQTLAYGLGLTKLDQQHTLFVLYKAVKAWGTECNKLLSAFCNLV